MSEFEAKALKKASRYLDEALKKSRKEPRTFTPIILDEFRPSLFKKLFSPLFHKRK